jgi:cytochrome c oxidase subunit 2
MTLLALTAAVTAEGRVVQSVLAPAGMHAERIARLWNVFLAVTAVIYALVVIALGIALVRRRAAGHEAGTPRAAFVVVTVASGLSAVTLFALLVASIYTGRAIAEVPSGGPRVTLTGHQWWWQVEYENADPSKRITSANELNVPVGVPVTIKLHSSDVIHSFWAPNLHGKRDLIPGHEGTITIRADRPGIFRGQCAEYCGTQHAKMAFWVNALTPADYARWTQSEGQPGHPPSTPGEREGQKVFLRSPCPLCHNIQGTDASGSTGPDLTHFGSRHSIAAGALPNERALLAGWILDPQHVKPGAQMPPMPLRREELEPLLDYLESLK